MVSIRKDIESLYTDSCDIYESEEYTEGNVTKHRYKLKYSDIKCRFSYETGLFVKMRSGEQKEDASRLKQSIKLFLPINIDVKAGSRVVIRHLGQVYTFVNSSLSAVYRGHTEIILDSDKEWA